MINFEINESTPTSAKLHLVAGRTFEIGKPVSRQIRAYSRGSGIYLASTRSDINGYYKMYLPLDISYTLVSIDPNKKFNAVIQDNVVPK